MGLNRHLTAGAVVIAAAVAIPQAPNFAAINAAPSVANGPSLVVNPDGAQTASLYTSFTVTGPTAVPSKGSKRAAKAVGRATYSTSVTDSGLASSFGTLSQLSTVNSGVDYWINGGITHNFFGNLNNAGRIVISQTSYLRLNPLAGGQTCNFVGHDANNGNVVNAQGALIQLNDYGSISAPTYDWYLHSLNNSGTMQFCGRGDTGGSTYQLYSDLDAVNNGLISFEQYNDNYGAAFVWRNPVLTTTNIGYNLYNNGAFRIINVVYHNVQNVYGNGCWEIGAGGVLYLEDGTGVFQNPNAGPSFPNQNIIFQDSTSVLHMDTAVYSRNSNFGPQLYGFARGNAIEFFQLISTFGYSASTGILNVAFIGGNQVNIKLGSGYTSTSFAKRNNPQKYNVLGYNAIFYDGAAPSQNVPSQCTLSAPVCAGLSGGLPPYWGMTTSSSSVAISTSSSSSPVTTPTTSSTSSSTPVTTPTTSSTSSSISVTSPTTSSATSSSSSSSLPITTPTTSSTSSGLPVTVPTTSSTSSSTSSSSIVSPTSSSSTLVTTTLPPTTTTARTCPVSSYTPYYAALAKGYTTDPALTGTTTANQPCPTTPEAGTYCGFINPLDPCSPQPDGYGPVSSPDTVSAFAANPSLHALASAAPSVIPSTLQGVQYSQVFRDLNASVSANSYLGLYVLPSYSAPRCAQLCDCTDLCTSFNLYAERDPSLAPSTDSSTAPTVWGRNCPDPPSMTSYKCTLWGSAISASDATNQGGFRERFQIVVAASDAWDATRATTPGRVPRCAEPEDLGGKAIDKKSDFLGARFFPGPFNPSVCGSFAFEQRKRNVEAGYAAGVAMFNAYYLTKNGHPHGTYCGLYAAAVGVEYATWSEGTSGGDRFECAQSWSYAVIG